MRRKKKEETVESELIQLEGIGPVSLKKLNGAGIFNLVDFAVRSPHEIASLLGYKDEMQAEQWQMLAKGELAKSGEIPKQEMTCYELLEYRSKIPRIRTNTTFDKIFSDMNSPNGGIEAEAITELYGEFGSGKTQICHTLVVECIKQLNKSVLWIDGEVTFRPERIVEIAIIRGYATDKEDAMNKFFPFIEIRNCVDSTSVITTLNTTHKLIKEKNIGLVICDGLTGKFREEYIGRGELGARQDQLKIFMSRLFNLAHIMRVFVVMTNQVLSNPGQLFGDPNKPMGGHIIGHMSTYRVYLTKSGKTERIATFVDSSGHARVQERFFLTKAGISDVEVVK